MMKTLKFTGILMITIVMGVMLLTGRAAHGQWLASWQCVNSYDGTPVAAYPGLCGTSEYIPGNPIIKIGIGTTSPQAPLHVVGGMRVDSICDVNGQHCKTVSAGWGAASNILTTPDGQTNVVSVNSSSNVGVGTTNPQSKFAVNGTITAKEVKVTQSGWSDYVFAEDYRLLPLDELEAYVNKEKHLPDIPAAREVEEKGLEVADTLSKQMQKIEELTLYLIQLKKENEQLKERITALEEKQ
jgi:hypothetical protein